MLTCKILIVDDDSDDREFFTDTFHKIGMWRIHAVSSARDAIAFLESIYSDEDLPRLIVTDLNMPRISGIELLETLKEMLRYSLIPVIVCTTSSSVYEAKRCLASGASEYITKPSALKDYEALTQKMCRLAFC
jgi:CheY-like chemotaxis protein